MRLNGREADAHIMDPAAGLSRDITWQAGDTQVMLVATPVTGTTSMLSVVYRRAANQGLWTRVVDAGLFASFSAGLVGRRTSSPPQFGHRSDSRSAQAAQNVHSKEQMRASGESGGRSMSQHSQPGLRRSMGDPW